MAGAEPDQPRNRVLLVIDRRGRQIEMDGVLAHLLLGDRQEADPESGVIRRHETDLVTGLVVRLPVQRFCPEARETERIVRIEAESDEPRSHPALHHPTCQATPADAATKACSIPAIAHRARTALSECDRVAVCALAGAAAGAASQDGRLVRGVRGVTEHRARARRSPPTRMPTSPPRNPRSGHPTSAGPHSDGAS
jgi:hypothetical protein